MNFWSTLKGGSSLEEKILSNYWLKNLLEPIFKDPNSFDSDCPCLKPSLTNLTESARLYEMQVVGCALCINIDDIKMHTEVPVLNSQLYDLVH